ncbi:hypothetical protein ACQ4LE_009683 [Meloidogyne hapla]|uniref:Uncharacterized protein n=1 Tax=Meloidogyne hapla TaxID=6305 RepID=A0A1I8BGD6_MELHA
MLRFIVSTNLFKYFGQRSRAFTTSSVKLCHFNENIGLSNYEKSSSNLITNETNIANQKESIRVNPLVQEKLQIGENDILNIILEQGISGKRTIRLVKMFRSFSTEWRWKFMHLPKLLFPDDCYNFIRALDEIIIACDCKEFVDRLNPNEELASEEFNTEFYDISIYLIRDREGRLFLKLLQKNKRQGLPEIPYFIQINVLPWNNCTNI